jgi:hypothetical protein
MTLHIQIDQINNQWVNVVYIDHQEESFDLPLSLFKYKGIDPKEGQVYCLNLDPAPHIQQSVHKQTHSQLSQLIEDDDGDDFSL